MKRRTVVIDLLVGAGVGASLFGLVPAYERWVTPETIRAESLHEARQILRDAQFLDNLCSGARADAGEHLWAFNVLLRAPEPAGEYERLLREGTRHGRLYALVGLKIVSPRRYAAASSKARRRDPLSLSFGCAGFELDEPGFVGFLDGTPRLTRYFAIVSFKPYLNDRARFLRESGRHMIHTGFGP